jgi:C1A family cysteine protease
MSFMTGPVGETGIMSPPKPGEASDGGHEVLCLGYDLPKQLALIQNSWSDGWGQRGYFWMPFSVIAAPDTDLWMVHVGRPW